MRHIDQPRIPLVAPILRSGPPSAPVDGKAFSTKIPLQIAGFKDTHTASAIRSDEAGEPQATAHRGRLEGSAGCTGTGGIGDAATVADSMPPVLNAAAASCEAVQTIKEKTYPLAAHHDGELHAARPYSTFGNSGTRPLVRTPVDTAGLV